MQYVSTGARGIITAFHNTLYKPGNDGPLWAYVAKSAVTPMNAAMHPARAIALRRANSRLNGFLEQYERGRIADSTFYADYNPQVLFRLPLGFVHAAVHSYAEMPETSWKLDPRVLYPIMAFIGNKGILSTGSRDFISDVNEMYGGCFPSRAIVANPIAAHGRGSILELEVNGNKPALLEREFFGPLGFDTKRTVYIGGSMEEEAAFECVAGNGGRISIPFFASPEFKEHASGKAPYRDRVFVPENELELTRFLRSI